MNDDSIKERILQATIELMRQDTANITVRKIAAQAGVTQGLINYHYQSKDRLTGLAAQRFVNARACPPRSTGKYMTPSSFCEAR